MRDMADPSHSDAFDEAVRCRAVGIGAVPVVLIRKMTREEWARIRLMTQAEARRMVAEYDAIADGAGNDGHAR